MTLEFIPAEEEFGALWFKWRQDPIARSHNPIHDQNELETIAQLWTQKGDFNDLRDGKTHRWFVLENRIAVGTVALERVNNRMKTATLGYQVGTEFSGRGLGTSMVKEFIKLIFANTDLYRIEATVHTENIASQKILEKVDFHKEGRLRKFVIIGEKRVDFYLYSPFYVVIIKIFETNNISVKF